MVIKCGISPEYFLDEMTDLELDALMYGSNIVDKGEWERCRFLAYVTACTMGAKIKTPLDLITFEWEKQEVPAITVTKEERNKLIKQYTEELNNVKQCCYNTSQS